MRSEEQQHEDEQLVESVKRGDLRAFEVLLKKYQKRVWNVAFLMVGNRDLADDITQEVFIKVYKKIDRYSQNTSFYSWLYRMTVNLSIDELRKRKVKKILSLNFLTEDGYEDLRSEQGRVLPSTEIDDDERREIVRKALKMISAEHREVLILREYENYGYNEIAETLGISIQAVKSRIFRARKELRDVIKRYFRDAL